MCEGLTFARILEAVADQAGVSAAELRGPSQKGGWSRANWPRQRALMIARRVLPALSWRALSKQMNGRNLRNLAYQAKTAERRHEADGLERAAVAEVLVRLGLDALPAYDDRQWRRAILDREIQSVEAKLADMRAARAELGEAA